MNIKREQANEKSRLRHPQKGFSLIELLITISILGILSAVIAQVTTQLHKDIARLEDKQTAVDLKNVLSFHFSNATACANTLGNLAVRNQQNIQAIRDQDNQNFLQSGQSWSALNINSIILQNQNLQNQPNRSGQMNLVFNIQSGRTSAPLAPITVPLQVATGANRRIAACSLMDLAAGSTGQCPMHPMFTAAPPEDPTQYRCNDQRCDQYFAQNKPAATVVGIRRSAPNQNTVTYICSSDGQWYALKSGNLCTDYPDSSIQCFCQNNPGHMDCIR